MPPSGANLPPGSAASVGHGRIVESDGAVAPVGEPSSAGEPLTIVGAAWRKIGDDAGLIVLARGGNGHGHEGSTPALTIYHEGRSYRFMGTVAVPSASASTTKKTYRFEFRVPPRVQIWSLERMVLSWQRAEFELPLPRSPAAGGGAAGLVAGGPGGAEPLQPWSTPVDLEERAPAVVGRPSRPVAQDTQLRQIGEPIEEHAPRPLGEPIEERYRGEISEAEAQLVQLRQEMARLRDEVGRTRDQRDDAYRERDRAREERDRAQGSLASVAGELEHVERELVERRHEFEQVVRELTARRAELEQLQSERPEPDEESEATRPAGLTEPPAVPRIQSPPEELVAPPEPDRAASAAQDQLAAALSEVRKQLERVQLAADTALDDGRTESGSTGEYGGDRLATAPPTPSGPAPPAVPRFYADDVPPPAGEAWPPALEPQAPPPEPQASTPEPPALAPEPQLRASDSPHQFDHSGARSPTYVDEAEGEEPADGHREHRKGSWLHRIAKAFARRDQDRDSWVSRALYELAEEDREAAGRVLVSMLPAQSLATPSVARYDLIVPKIGIYATDVDGRDTRIESRERPRPLTKTDAWITGSLVQLGDLAAWGNHGILRRLRRYPVAVEGDRRRVDDLIALSRAPARLRDLCEVGVQLEIPLLLRMVASAIAPRWTRGHRFTICFEPTDSPEGPSYFRVDLGGPTRVVARSPREEPATTVRTSAWALIHFLADAQVPEGEELEIAGDSEPLELLQDWIQRLEEGSSDQRGLL